MAPEDIWNRLESAASPNETPDEWLIRQGGMLLGPVSSTTVINKLLQGEFDGESLVAADGDDAFLPMKQIAAFRPHVEKASRLIASRKRKRLVLLVALFLLVLVPSALGGLWWARKQGYLGKPRSGKAMAKGVKGKTVSASDVPDLKLVALVDLDKAQSGLKVRRKKPKGKGPKGKGPKSTEMEGPVGCQLSDQQIFGVVKRNLSRWLVCVQNLADHQPDAVPAKLHLGFTVTTTGGVKDFKVINRHLRRGPFRNCMFKFFNQMKFPKSKGSNCTIDDWPIPLKK